MQLSNKVVVVTGGSGLLGRSIINRLTVQGAFVINADIDVENSLENHTVKCDVTNEASVVNAIDFILKNYERIDGWINNAYPRTADWGKKFESIPYESWKQNVDKQLNSIFLCCQHVLKVMESQKFGSIVNLASIYGVVGPDFSVYQGTEMTMPAAYSAIKGGVINFTKYLASYYGPSNIRVNCVSPGGVFDNQNQGFVDKYSAKVPLRRMALPDDIAPSVCFLLSDDASYITGQNLVVDGGWTII